MTTFTETQLSRYENRIVIKFLWKSGKRPTEIHQEMTKVYGDDIPSVQTVRKWVRDLEEGRESLEDEQRSGRPVSASTEATVTAIQMRVEADRRVRIIDIAEEHDISFGTVQKIITEDLKMRKLCAKWIPHILTDEQKGLRMNLCSKHRRRFRRNPSSLERIIAADETWVHCFEPELKRQSAEWTATGESRPTKARRSQGSLKVMHITFFDHFGILVDWPVPPGTSVNGDYYQWVLREKLRPAIRKKRPNLLNDGVILLHDNASAHTKRTVVEMLTEDWSWEILPHPPYSPDLSPCDFFLFPKAKEQLRGRRFTSLDEINDAWRQSLNQLATRGLQDGIKKLPHRWQKCIVNDGAYFE